MCQLVYFVVHVIFNECFLHVHNYIFKTFFLGFFSEFIVILYDNGSNFLIVSCHFRKLEDCRPSASLSPPISPESRKHSSTTSMN